jgi:ubiquinone/menaquinone biosynthesis C-methylase UbiE
VAADELAKPIFARFYDRFLGRDKLRGEAELRAELVAGLTGRVVEVGVGNGISFEHYPPEVSELVAVEPEPYLRAQAQRAAHRLPLAIRVVSGVADSIDAADASFDAVVVAGVLCSVPDQAAALAEFRRLVRPGGELRFYEHVRSRRPGFARYQDRVDPLWSRAMGGCHPNRDTLAAIETAGFELEHCRGFGFPPEARAYPVAPRIIGVARA